MDGKRGHCQHGARGLDVCRNVLVVGRGKPYHITETEAAKLVLRGAAIWQKAGRRIKYTRGKHSHPQVRDLGCTITKYMVAALHNRKDGNHELAKLFVNQTQRKRERA